MISIPLLALATIGFFYWRTLQERDDLDLASKTFEEEKRVLKKQIKQKALSKAALDRLKKRYTKLLPLSQGAYPISVYLLADLEENLPPSITLSYLNASRDERKGDLFDFQLRGVAPNTVKVAKLSKNLEEAPCFSVRLHSMKRNDDAPWGFNLSGKWCFSKDRSSKPKESKEDASSPEKKGEVKDGGNSEQ